MSLMIPNEGKIWAAKRVLYSNAGSEDMSLRLFKNNITPAETDVLATYTIADFTGYASVTLTSSQSAGTWAVPTTSSNIGFSTYGTNATYTASATGSDQTVYGVYYAAPTAGICFASQAFGAGKPLVGLTGAGDSITVTPKLQFTHI